MKAIAILLSIVLVLATLGGGFLWYKHAHAVHQPQPTSVQAVDPETTTISKPDLLKEVNKERAKYGAAPLVEDSRLDASAQAKADDETSKGYFDHTCPGCLNGMQESINNLGNAKGHFSENLTQPTPVSTRQAIYNWDNSTLHHDAMIDGRYTITGFGISGTNVVEEFYSPTQF